MTQKTKERRKSKRREILQSFGAFIVVKKKGVHRLPLHDISDHGLGFDLDVEGETPADFPLTKGEDLTVHFHFNPTLYVELRLRAVRIEGAGAIRKAGCEFLDDGDQDQAAMGAFRAYLQFIDQLDALPKTASTL